MRTPQWAPCELVEIHKQWMDAQEYFRQERHTAHSLNAFAKREGFGSWSDMEKRNILLSDMLGRLLHRPEMKDIWSALGKTDGYRGRSIAWWTYRELGRVVDLWFQSPKLSDAGRKRALKEVSQAARNLSRKLQPFELGHGRLTDIIGLMDTEHDKLIRRVLHPDIVARMDDRVGGVNYGRVLIQELVPTLSEMLDRLAEGVTNWPVHAPVRKMSAKNALRTYIISRMAFFFIGHDAYSPTTVATFVAVALDDHSVTPTLVSKMCRNIVAELSS